MSSKSITVYPVSLQDSLMFLWKLRNMVSNAEYEIFAMVNWRQQLALKEDLLRRSTLPLITLNDDLREELDLADEALAESLFLELRNAVTNFVDSYSGVTVANNPNMM